MSVEPWDPFRQYKHGDSAIVRGVEAVRANLIFGQGEPCQYCPHFDNPDAPHLPAPHGCRGCNASGLASVWVNIQQYGLMRLKGEI